jgi:hypothetical protein
MNCNITNNRCGTDQWPIGRPCLCDNCQQWLRASFKEGIEPIVDFVLSQGVPTSLTEIHTVLMKAAVAAYQAGYAQARKDTAPAAGSGIPAPDGLY